MSHSARRFAFVVSTGGAVMNAVLQSSFLRSQIDSVVIDYEGFDAAKLRELGVRYSIIAEPDPQAFCRKLLTYAQSNGIEYILSYYTKFYTAEFRNAFRNRIVNFHPSLLPAFKGMDGFGDAVAYFARFTGNTVEFIDQVMDEGKIIMQTVCPIDRCAPIASTRHAVFVQQCQALIQTVRWLYEDRIRVDGRRVIVHGATFDDRQFSPGLDYPGAQSFLPQPGELKASIWTRPTSGNANVNSS